MAAETLNARYEIIENTPDADTRPFAVAKARDITEGRVVTLQALSAARIAAGPTERAAFVAAARAAARLYHANVSRVYDQGETEDDDLFVVSEYTRGITLKERIRRIAPFALAVAADLAVAIAEALEYAHDAGVLHGDLRPHNVTLSPEGQIKVSGFAYSRAGTLLTGEGPDPLYAAYVAPEQTARAAATVSADIYALGATLYEMLTGVLPPVAPSAAPAPRALNPGVPPALDGIVQKALHPDPLWRYRSVAPLLADLRAAREALRMGRSLAWSPVAEKPTAEKPTAERPSAEKPTAEKPTAEKRAPRPPAPADTPRPVTPPAPAPPGPEAEPPEERDYGSGRSVSRALSITLAVLFVVAVLGIVGLSWYATRFLAIPNDVVVPNLIGKTFDDAKRLAAQQHFTLVETDPDTPHYSPIWPENQIFHQKPLAGNTIKAGRDVTVLRSAGPPLLQVPDLTGMVKARATSTVQGSGLPLGDVTDDYSDSVPSGIVLSQSPAKLAMVARGTSVGFVVSRGKQPPDIPEGVNAVPGSPSTIVLTWKRTARADSYSVTRAQDSDSKVIAQEVKGTQITDSGLLPQTTYTYTVTAVNAGGSSDASEPETVTTPALVVAPPVLPPDAGTPDPAAPVDTVPPPAPDAGSGGDSPRMRQFTITFRVPRHPGRQRHVQFEIQDALGLSKAFDEYRDPGSEVDAPIQAFGNRITFRIFLDDKLVKQQTL